MPYSSVNVSKTIIEINLISDCMVRILGPMCVVLLYPRYSAPILNVNIYQYQYVSYHGIFPRFYMFYACETTARYRLGI